MHLLLILAGIIVLAAWIGGRQMVGTALVLLALLGGGIAYIDHRSRVPEPFADQVIDPVCVKRQQPTTDGLDARVDSLFAELACSRPRTAKDVTVTNRACVERAIAHDINGPTPRRVIESHCQFLTGPVPAAAGRSADLSRTLAAGD